MTSEPALSSADPMPADVPRSDLARPEGAQGTVPRSPAGPATEAPPSAFAPTRIGPAPFEPAPAAASTAFDVCHAGVVLRAVLGVHGVIGLATAFVFPAPAAWLAGFAAACAVSLPALLLWLIAACALKRPIARLPAGGRLAAAAGLGALAAVAGLAVPRLTGFDDGSRWPWLPAALAGAAAALAIAHWLQLRARALVPADADARLAQLQARIRPHFLFNTLNSAVALVRVDPARAEGVLEDLAELFRAVLAADAQPGAAVTLDEEIALARRYLEIEQVRFGERLRVRWELDPAAGAARVPLLLLQPLVENAVRHGVEPAEEGGLVRVRTRARRGEAWISIANTRPDGPSRPGSGLALDNVRERLRLMHDVAARFDAGPDGDVWRVQIVVPLAA